MKNFLGLCISVIALLIAPAAWATTFYVTSPNCAGPGSFQAAVELANLNLGPDTVSFQVDVDGVNDVSCNLAADIEPAFAYMAVVKDDLVIEGNGHSITGGSKWVAIDGITNAPGTCPWDSPLNTILSNPVGLVRIDDNAVVTVNDLRLNRLRSIAEMRAATSLTLDRVTALDTFNFYRDCDTSAIYLGSGEGHTVTIKDSVFDGTWNKGTVLGSPDGQQTWFNAFIWASSSQATVSISGSRFQNFGEIPVIDSEGTVNIETSLVYTSGWVNIRGGTAKIVNSVFMSSLGQAAQSRIMASSNASILLEASTVALGTLDCINICPSRHGEGAIIATDGATIELKGSAVGVQYDVGDFERTVLIREATGGNVTATAAPNPNWVQPVIEQDAGDLQAILDQPALLTDAPGLPIDINSFLFFFGAATPLLDDGAGTPGLLIDAVTGADTTNVLLSPIDGSPITKDIWGNPRTEAGGTVRNIGAVQLGLAPTLNLTATGDELVDLNWTRLLDPSSGAITGYEVCFGTGTVPDPSALGTDCEDGDGNPASLETIASAPDTLAGQVTSLTNGDTYWFLVRGVNVSGGGPWSNVVNGTPYGEIGTPSLTVTSTSCGSAFLEWTQPDLGGRTFSGYIVTWAVEGTDVALGSMVIDDYDTLSATVSGLDCNVRYRFTVTANTTDGATGGQGMGSVLVPPLPPVPALGQLGLLLLTLLVLSFGTVGVRRFG